MRFYQTSLNNFEILNAVKRIDLINFCGVFLRDPLPKKPKRHECGIMNLDDSSGNGTHWVAWFKRGNDKWYLDPFGLPPEYIFTFRIFEQLALALKNRVALKFLTVLKYYLSFRIFEQLALALKNKVCPGIFHGIEIFCTILDF